MQSQDPPIHNRWFPQGQNYPFMSLPPILGDDDELIISSDQAEKLPYDMIRERIFHFSLESVAKLKAKANAEEIPVRFLP